MVLQYMAVFCCEEDMKVSQVYYIIINGATSVET